MCSQQEQSPPSLSTSKRAHSQPSFSSTGYQLLPVWCPAAVPLLTRSPGGPSAPGAPCGETIVVVGKWGRLASIDGGHRGHGQRTHLVTRLSGRSRLTLVSRCALHEQATGVQMTQVSRFQSKDPYACRTLGKLCSEAKAGAGDLSLSRVGRGCLRRSTSPTFSPGLPGIPGRPGFPSSPGSPFTRTQGTVKSASRAKQWILVPTLQRLPGAPLHPKPLSGLWSLTRELLILSRSPHHLPSESHLVTRPPQYLRDARVSLVGTC